MLHTKSTYIPHLPSTSWGSSATDNQPTIPEFEWKRKEYFVIQKTDPPILVMMTKEPPGHHRSRSTCLPALSPTHRHLPSVMPHAREHMYTPRPAVCVCMCAYSHTFDHPCLQHALVCPRSCHPRTLDYSNSTLNTPRIQVHIVSICKALLAAISGLEFVVFHAGSLGCPLDMLSSLNKQLTLQINNRLGHHGAGVLAHYLMLYTIMNFACPSH